MGMRLKPGQKVLVVIETATNTCYLIKGGPRTIKKKFPGTVIYKLQNDIRDLGYFADETIQVWKPQFINAFEFNHANLRKGT